MVQYGIVLVAIYYRVSKNQMKGNGVDIMDTAVSFVTAGEINCYL